MVLQKLLQLLMAHPQFGPRLVQRLSETWPIRRAARFTAYLYLRGKQGIEDNVKPGAAQRIGDNFKSELAKQWEQVKKEIAEEQKKSIRK